MARGKILILVAGIIMTIYGAISFVVSLVPLVGGSLAVGTGAVSDAVGKDGSAVVAVGAAVILVSLIPLVISAIQLAFGISGIKYCGKPERAGTIFKIGVFLVVIRALALGIELFGNAYGTTKAQHVSEVSIVTSALIGMILPILYIVGAQLNKKSLSD